MLFDAVYGIIQSTGKPDYVGLNFKLDVGLYRLNQQVACQRYRQTTTNAKTSVREAMATVSDLFSRSNLKLAPALV